MQNRNIIQLPDSGLASLPKCKFENRHNCCDSYNLGIKLLQYINIIIQCIWLIWLFFFFGGGGGGT